MTRCASDKYTQQQNDGGEGGGGDVFQPKLGNVDTEDVVVLDAITAIKNRFDSQFPNLRTCYKLLVDLLQGIFFLIAGGR